MDILKLARSFTTADGVTLHMLPFTTPLHLRVGRLMRAEVGIKGDDGMVSLREEEATYVMCVALTVGIDLPAAAPTWAIILADFLKDKSYLSDPVSRWYELAAIAPIEMFGVWWAAQKATRPIELMAPEALQSGLSDDAGDAAADGEEIARPPVSDGAA